MQFIDKKLVETIANPAQQVQNISQLHFKVAGRFELQGENMPDIIPPGLLSKTWKFHLPRAC